MDRITRGVRRLLMTLIEVPMSNYHFVLIIGLLISKLNYFGEDWEWQSFQTMLYEAIPFKVLSRPIRLTFFVLLLILRLPSLPNDNATYIMMMIYMQITNSVVLGVIVKFLCVLHPYHCYEGYEAETDEIAVSIQMMFAMIQLVITLMMIFTAWFLNSIKDSILAIMNEFGQFIARDFFILMGIFNFILLMMETGLQNVAIVLVLLQMIWKMATEIFVVNPIINFMTYDFALFLDDYEDNLFENRRGIQAHNPRAFHFMPNMVADHANENGIVRGN